MPAAMAARASAIRPRTKARLWMLSRRQAVGSPTAAGGGDSPATTGQQVVQAQAGSRGASSVAWTALRRLSRPRWSASDPWRAIRVGATQSNWSTPRATASSMPDRVAHPHQVPGPVGGEVGDRGGQRLEHGRAGLPHRQAADAVAVEVRGPRCARALSSRRPGSVPPWTMPNSAWPSGRASSRSVAAPGPGGPRAPCARRPRRSTSGGGRQGGADVEHHLDVGPDQALGLDGRLRGQPDAACRRRPRRRSRRRRRPRAERVDLVAARVGQGVPGPPGEPVQATEGGHRVGARGGASGGTCWPGPPRRPAPRGRRCRGP